MNMLQTEVLPASLQMDEGELLVILEDMYPGAKPETKKLVIQYCRAMNFDPLLKPVHIVPMTVKTGKVDAKGYDIKEKRDVIMPGIGQYRIQAARTGAYAGLSEPEFGPEQVTTVKKSKWVDSGRKKSNGDVQWEKDVVDVEIKHPLWCKITVYRLVAGNRVGFTAVEYWTENAATNADGVPNEMWTKRAYGQLAKCCEAQALRKGFPEVGVVPTYDEMEGREVIDDAPPVASTAKPLSKSEQQKALPNEPIEGVATRVPDQEVPATDERAANIARAQADAAAQGAPIPGPQNIEAAAAALAAKMTGRAPPAQPTPPPATPPTGSQASAGAIAHIKGRLKDRLDEACEACQLTVRAATIESLTTDGFTALRDKAKEWKL